MANICTTEYRLQGTRILEFWNALLELEHGKPIRCRDIAHNILHIEDDIIEKCGISLRGEVIYYDMNDEIMTMVINSAWTPLDELMEVICNEYELDYLYMADERGCCGIWSNDINHEVWDWKYVIYSSYGGDEEEFSNEEDAVDWINQELRLRNLKPISHLSDLDGEDYEDYSVTEVEYD